MKDIINSFVVSFNQNNITKLYDLLDDNCLFINYDSKVSLSKEKVINTLIDLKSHSQIKSLNLINTVKDSDDTLLIAYNVITETSVMPLFGSAVVRFNNTKIIYIKNFLIQ